jgi:hypothetical protein
MVLPCTVNEYMMHWVEKTRSKRKRRHDNGGQLRSLTVSDDLRDLFGTLDGHSNGGAVNANVANQINNNMLRNSKPCIGKIYVDCN